MKKTRRLILTALSMFTATAISLSATSCFSSNNPSSENANSEFRQVYAMYVAYAENQGISPLSYEEWLESIRGEKGAQGEQGIQGDKGDKGDKGEDGANGKDGVDGKSAYEIWLEAGHEGTEADFLAWLKGEKGKNGENGVGIEKVEFDKDGNLLITFTDGTTQTVEMPEPETHVHTFGDWTPLSGETSTLFFRICNDCKSVEWQDKSDKYTVDFRYNFGTDLDSFEQTTDLRYGTLLSAPAADPVREGYTFNGWWTAAQGGTRAEFPVTVRDNATYYAQWISEAVVTNTFQAEFTFIDPSMKFLGLSGEVTGSNIILPAVSEIEGIIHNESDYPNDSTAQNSKGHYVSYLYKKGTTLTFKIYSTEDVDNVTLSANLATEFKTNVSVGPTGDNAWEISVNGTVLNYTPFTMDGALSPVSCITPFKMYTIATNVSLKAGENVITFTTNNTNAFFGTTQAFAPTVDCITLTETGSAELSYYPIYENILG